MRSAMRRTSLCLALALAATALGTSQAAAASSGFWSYVSAPSLHPPKLAVNTNKRGQAPGLIFVSNFPNLFLGKPLVGDGGPMILDNQGRIVWSHPVPASIDALNFQAQTYRRRPVLTWWQGNVSPKDGEMTNGVWYLADSHYRIFKTLVVGNLPGGWMASAHEFRITSRGTALLTAYRHVPMDISAYGGPSNATILDSAVIEINIRTGRVVYLWDFLAHVPVSNSEVSAPKSTQAPPWDPYHINSIDEDRQGNLLVSARNTWAIYKIKRSTGNILWTLGGKASTFSLASNATFAFQHNAQFQNGNQISLFDDECCNLIPQPSGPPKTAPPVYRNSRGLILKLDVRHHRATVAVQRYLYNLVAGTQGNTQIEPNGNMLVGWGQQPFYSEYSRSGKLLLSIRFPDPDISYRVYRYAWVGHPVGRPVLVLRVTPQGKSRLYVSWNGATQIARYEVLAGSSRRNLKVVRVVGRGPFETVTTLAQKGPFFEVIALDAAGHRLGTSNVVHRPGGSTQGTSPAPLY